MACLVLLLRRQLALPERQGMAIALMDRVKHLPELRIALGGEEDTAAAAEHEGAVVFNATAVFDDLHFRVISAHLDLARIASGEGLRRRIAVQSEPGRQFNRYRILFGPCIIEIDRVAALTGREERIWLDPARLEYASFL